MLKTSMLILIGLVGLSVCFKETNIDDSGAYHRGGMSVKISKRDIAGVEVMSFLMADLDQRSYKREDFASTKAVKARMALLDAKEDDDKGHIIASNLGGPAAIWNLVPMARRLNRGNRSGVGWRNLEKKVESFLKGSCCRKVHWTVDLEYNDWIDGRVSRRPSSLTVEAIFVENGKEKPDVYRITCDNSNDSGVCDKNYS